MKFVKNLMPSAGHKAKSLKYALHKTMQYWRAGRAHQVVHASDVTDFENLFCPRQYALLDLTDKKRKDRWVTTSMDLTFHIGRWVASYIVHTASEAGIAVGDWECEGCGKIYKFVKIPVKCSCKHKSFAYREVRFKSEVSGISGGIDLLVDFGAPKLFAVEIKTIDKIRFKELKGPLAEHRLRTNLYLRLIAEDGSHHAKRVNTKEALLIYSTKGGYGVKDTKLKDWDLHEQFSPFKEYWIKRDDEATEYGSKQAKKLLDWRSNNGPMPDGVCPSMFCKTAKDCPVISECFGGSYPAGYPLYKEE